MSREELRIKGFSRLQDAMADHHKLALTGRNHRLNVHPFSHQLVVKGPDDGVVTNCGQSWKKQTGDQVHIPPWTGGRDDQSRLIFKGATGQC